MKRLITFSAAALALVANAAQSTQYDGKNRLQSKGECEDKCIQILRDQKAAAEAHKGRRIHLVDLDDKKQLREYEDDGLCINIGDQVFVTGIEDKANGQDWKQYGILLDDSIVQVTADADIRVSTPPLGYSQELFVLTGMASGQTVFQVEQTGPCQKPRRIDLALFVNPDRCPRRERKNKKHDNDDDNDNDNKKKQYQSNDDEE